MKFDYIFIEFIKVKADFFSLKIVFQLEKIRFYFDRFNKNIIKLHIFFSPLNSVYLCQKRQISNFSHRLNTELSPQRNALWGIVKRSIRKGKYKSEQIAIGVMLIAGRIYSGRRHLPRTPSIGTTGNYFAYMILTRKFPISRAARGV